MPKYKIVASKSQKKYTLVISADSQQEAKEKIHKENYSILSVSEYEEGTIIEGKKFLFQVEQNGDIKNGIILGEDIFKVYIKLKDELGYNIIFLYPEGDEAHNSAEKKQKIMDQLKYGYDLQVKTIKFKEQKLKSEESFYLKKELEETYILIEKVLEKLTAIIENRSKYVISNEVLDKVLHLSESLIRIKGSTNLSKLKEIGELALIKIAQIELQNVEETKNIESRELLKSTNQLLKKIGSREQFREQDKDIKKIFFDFLRSFQNIFSLKVYNQERKEQKDKKNILDTESYNFLKTILLLEKYKEKLLDNTREIHYQKFLFYNPFKKSEFKEKHLLKRKVILQNISILKAKKTGSIGSYTFLKKGYIKVLESFLSFTDFIKDLAFTLIFIYICFFFIYLVQSYFHTNFLVFQSSALFLFFGLYFLFFLLSVIRFVPIFISSLVFFTFLSIFSYINF